MNTRFLDLGSTILGAAEERYWSVSRFTLSELFVSGSGFYSWGFPSWRSLFCYNTYLCRFKSVSVLNSVAVLTPCLSTSLGVYTDVARGCCQTNLGISGSVFRLVVSGVSLAVRERKEEYFRLKLSTMSGCSEKDQVVRLVVEPDFVLPVLFSGEAIFFLHWLRMKISRWGGMSSHKFHRVRCQFLGLCHFCFWCIFCSI